MEVHGEEERRVRPHVGSDASAQPAAGTSLPRSAHRAGQRIRRARGHDAEGSAVPRKGGLRDRLHVPAGQGRPDDDQAAQRIVREPGRAHHPRRGPLGGRPAAVGGGVARQHVSGGLRERLRQAAGDVAAAGTGGDRGRPRALLLHPRRWRAGLRGQAPDPGSVAAGDEESAACRIRVPLARGQPVERLAGAVRDGGLPEHHLPPGPARPFARFDAPRCRAEAWLGELARAPLPLGHPHARGVPGPP